MEPSCLVANDYLAAGSQGGYDLLVGTSERGTVAEASKVVLPPFRHALLAFGGPKGLEDCAARDPSLQGRQAADLFNAWLNTAPAQVMARLRPCTGLPWPTDLPWRGPRTHGPPWRLRRAPRAYPSAGSLSEPLIHATRVLTDRRSATQMVARAELLALCTR